MKKVFYITIIVSIFSAVSGCKKFVTIPTPQNQLTTQQVFADSTDAVAAILNIYIKYNGLSNGINGYGPSLIQGLSSDEIYQTGSNSDYNQFYNNNILASNNTNLGLWNAGYTAIYDANACIAGVTSSKGISAAAKTQLIAEVEFIRAFELFYLVNFFGGVPIPLTTDYTVNELLPRSSTTAVYTQIIADLKNAENGLPPFSGTNIRPTSAAAEALLAKVYLFNGDYTLAKAESEKVINSGSFSLESDLKQVFLTNSSEIIWQLASILPNEGSGDGYLFVTSSKTAVPKYVITPSLYNSFEAGDLRKTSWIAANIVKGTNYPYPFKYAQGVTTNTIDEYEVMLRYADLYLIRAEAEINLGDLSDAIGDINIIRNRAGLDNTSATSQSDLFVALQNERRWEFFCERGNRWFDLKRWNLATQFLSPIKMSWNANDELYPIPGLQINYDPKLTQNPGY